MPRWVDELHAAGQHYMIILDPGISTTVGYRGYDSGTQMDIWVKTPRGKNFVGSVAPGPVNFPDWFNPNASLWWEENLREAHDMVIFLGIFNNSSKFYCDLNSYYKFSFEFLSLFFPIKSSNFENKIKK